MPTFESISNTCRNRFADEIATTYSVQSQYDNAPFNIDDSDLGSYGVWARVYLVWGDRTLGEISGSSPTAKTHRQHGQLDVQLRAEIEAGEKNLLLMSELVKDVFKGTTVDGVKFLVPKPVSFGMVEEEKVWWRLDVQCPFYAESVE